MPVFTISSSAAQKTFRWCQYSPKSEYFGFVLSPGFWILPIWLQISDQRPKETFWYSLWITSLQPFSRYRHFLFVFRNFVIQVIRLPSTEPTKEKNYLVPNLGKLPRWAQFHQNPFTHFRDIIPTKVWSFSYIHTYIHTHVIPSYKNTTIQGFNKI